LQAAGRAQERALARWPLLLLLLLLLLLQGLAPGERRLGVHGVVAKRTIHAPVT
jgi:hypothetical protein